MYCTNCGRWNEDSWAYCLGCGTPLLSSPSGQGTSDAPGAHAAPAGIENVRAVLQGPTGTVDLSGKRPSISIVRKRTGQTYDIAPLPATLGKGSAATVRIDNNNAISRAHVRISFTGASFVVEELGATNMTHINGKRLQESEISILKDGDELKLADEAFEVQIR